MNNLDSREGYQTSIIHERARLMQFFQDLEEPEVPLLTYFCPSPGFVISVTSETTESLSVVHFEGEPLTASSGSVMPGEEVLADRLLFARDEIGTGTVLCFFDSDTPGYTFVTPISGAQLGEFRFTPKQIER